MKVFWSWQSDIPGKIGRHLVRDALRDAIEAIREDPDDVEEAPEETRRSLHLDQDRQGVTGSPDLASTIFRKIDASRVFVADVTPVGTANTEGVEDPKKLINPNVAIETGYALARLGDERLLMVMNSAYGNREDLPFDLRQKAGPIMYDLSPDVGPSEIQSARRSLASQFRSALKPYLNSTSAGVESGPQPRAFNAREPADGRARFRPEGEPLGYVESIFPRRKKPEEVFLAKGPSTWLRLMPAHELDVEITSVQVHDAAVGGNDHIFPLSLGSLTNLEYMRHKDGFGVFALDTGNGGITSSVVFAFNTGEIWGIDVFDLDNSESAYVPFVEREFTSSLESYSRFLSRLEIKHPYRWVAGMSGVKGALLHYPQSPDSNWFQADGAGPCYDETSELGGEHNPEESALGSLLPFFDRVFHACNIERPAYLNDLYTSAKR